MRKYDLVITSDSPPVKGLILNQSAVQICYCHTPGRYLWDLYAEFRSELPRAVRPLYTLAAQYVRGWDFAAAQRVDHFVANSNYVAQRIWKYYRRQSSVIYPPIETGRGYLSDKQEDYYLSVGRLVHNKRLDLVIQACNRLGRKLLIAGAGRSEKQLKALAGPTVEFLGRLPDREIDRLYAKCKAFLFAADEDFGIAPVEAQSFGRPVICLGRGGSRETVLEVGAHSSPTGVLFAEQTVESVIGAILRFEAIEHIFEPRRIQAHSRQFDKSRFEKCFKDLVRHEVPLFTEEAPVQGVLAANAVNG
jgi:glycosyltransferase involved in cell wall biosynthesis